MEVSRKVQSASRKNGLHCRVSAEVTEQACLIHLIRHAVPDSTTYCYPKICQILARRHEYASIRIASYHFVLTSCCQSSLGKLTTSCHEKKRLGRVPASVQDVIRCGLCVYKGDNSWSGGRTGTQLLSTAGTRTNKHVHIEHTGKGYPLGKKKYRQDRTFTS